MPKNNSKCILFVDDEPLYTQFYGEALRALGYTVVTAKNGEEALEKIKDQSFQLLIVDLIMPILSGISFLKKIRRKKIPILVLTTLEGETDREDAMRYGAKAFLKKGETSAEQLKEAVETIFNPL